MKKFILFFFLAVFSFTFFGCPYYASVSIDKPGIKVDDKYTGIWNLKNGNTQYSISKSDDFHLNIFQLPYVAKDSEPKSTNDTVKYLGFFSKVKDVLFLNISQVTNNVPSEGFYLYKVEVKSESEIALTEVTVFIKEKFSSSENLKAFIEKYMDLSFFFANETVYIR